MFVWDIQPVHFVRWNLLTCFSCFCNLGFPDIPFRDLLRFEYITSLFSCLCISMLTSNSSGNMQKHGYLGCFNAVSARENISWVWVIFWWISQCPHTKNISHISGNFLLFSIWKTTSHFIRFFLYFGGEFAKHEFYHRLFAQLMKYLTSGINSSTCFR